MNAERGKRSRPPPGGCPRGLEVLTSLDQIIVHQQSELLEGEYVVNTETLYEPSTSRAILKRTPDYDHVVRFSVTLLINQVKHKLLLSSRRPNTCLIKIVN